MSKFAGIIVNNDSIQVDRKFTYKIPQELEDKIQIGHRVKVSFGMGKNLTDGFVVELYDDIREEGIRIKRINSLCDEEPLFNYKDFIVMEYMKEKYLCTYIEIIRLFIPKGVIKGAKHKEKQVVYALRRDIEGTKYDKEPYKKIISIIEENQGAYSKSELNKQYNISLSSINTLIKNGYLTTEDTIINRYNSKEYDEYKERNLTIEQKSVVRDLLNGINPLYLLKGVTGSGKTEVYMHIVKKMLERGKSAILLVPEISLTPQMVERFKGRFGKEVAVFHSRLSDGERFDEWFRVKNGEVKLAVGARSALFLPFDNLGIIIIDEEHENSYKSESNPKYNAKEVAEFMAKLKGFKVLMGTATPSIETYYRVKNREIKLLTLNTRADGAKMPTIEVIDMREELRKNNRSMFSDALKVKLKDVLESGEQAILFLNRRGFSTFVSCRKCGYVFKCNNCDITLTYHANGNFLSCHYCGHKERLSHICPNCKSNYVKYFGVGTEQVELSLKKEFGDVKTLRMDLDTTREKNSFERIYRSFRDGEAQVLIGTQMIAKGLDFPNVTLVGVLAADLSLNLPDYRSPERTYQLLTQVSGRAGRGNKEGTVIIQTYSPDNYSLNYSIKNDYDGFFNKELEVRKAMEYPPFTKIMVINMSSKNEKILIGNIGKVSINLKKMLENTNIDILGPSPCIISKIKEMYRWQILIKGDFSLELANKVRVLVYNITKELAKHIRISIDINPNSLI
ncbi:primosomal protein N' [Clostridium frigidicarnis]|uniref:Replication restart protein PriA n=1 Tax=Clostridium frigidicarnis TaxID=84698 RepID=A0A1I0ZMN0_9CLOT|nr:primosomal protein N' [Clostridium frigidicarnis]SFB26751.1 replication restart DNA helicase PriA [Clostridium frigidicarnis]